ncbi:MAG: ATP-binding cassette domain-containing protein [Acidobacteria bacterium]|nr:ATP-binding cassette domain-containing protein [Acidobacteriota bacterium]
MDSAAISPVRLESVRYQIGEALILDDVTLDAAAGQTLALLGRSGSGKTSLLRLINRLQSPSAGEVWVEDRRTLDWDPIRLRRRIGYVIQEVGLFPHWSVERNVGVVPRLEGRPEEAVRRRVRELLELVGLEPDAVAARRPRELSGGQRQRVGVARALAADPPILLLDEPFGALDPITRRDLQQELLRLQGALRKTIVLVTHDVREALLLADRIALLEQGRVVWRGTPAEFEAAPEERVRRFRESAA